MGSSSPSKPIAPDRTECALQHKGLADGVKPLVERMTRSDILRMQIVPDEITTRAEHALGYAQYRAVTSVARRVAGLERRKTRLSGTLVPYLHRPSRKGEGAPIVMIHGFGGDKESWLICASFLRRARGLVIPDLPGFGAAGPIPKERACAAAQGRALVELLDHLGVARAHLVGNSMGGGIALRFAKDHPHRTASLALIGSVGPFVVKSEVAEAVDRGENPLVTTSPDDLDRLLKLVAERVPPSTRAMRRYLGADRFARREVQEALFDGFLNAPECDQVPAELERIEAPALVIHGDRDRVIHPSTGRALHERLPNARLEIMSGVGHVPQIEKPKRTAEILDGFVDTVSG